MSSDKMVVMNKTVATLLAKKHPHKTLPPVIRWRCTKNTYFIPVDIMEDVVKLVAQKLSGSSIPGYDNSEALQGCL